MPFNPLYELERLTFIKNRDGLESALIYANGLIHTYLKAARDSKVKFRTKKYQFRSSYVESAYSCRFILRNNFLEGL